MKRTRLAAGAAIAACGSTAQMPAVASTHGHSMYSYYRSMMGRLYSGLSGSSGMMGGTSSRSWMMGGSGYRWMMGGLDAPAWMCGQALPGAMMGTSSDPGKVMGALFANAPGAGVSPAEATRLGGQIPAGATASRTQNNITFSGTSVRFTVLASPADGRDETFRIAGMTNPTVIVKASARVSIEVINTDSDTAHGLVVTASRVRSSWMPMMTARPAARTCPPTERLQRRSSARKAEWHPAGLPGASRWPTPRPRDRRAGRGRRRPQSAAACAIGLAFYRFLAGRSGA